MLTDYSKKIYFDISQLFMSLTEGAAEKEKS